MSLGKFCRYRFGGTMKHGRIFILVPDIMIRASKGILPLYDTRIALCFALSQS